MVIGAEALASAIVPKLVAFMQDLLIRELNRELELPKIIKEGIESLKGELEMITAVLKEADEEQKHKPTQVWIQEISNIAYEIEDVLDRVAYQSAAGTNIWPERKSIAALIEEIDGKLKRINEKRTRYGCCGCLFQNQSLTCSSNDRDIDEIGPLHTPEVEIVGFEEPEEELAAWVLDTAKAYKAMFVVGMGGSGKTTLVKLVYEKLKKEFNCHVWITASKFGKSQEVMEDMLAKLCNEKGSSLHPMIDRMKNYLQDKRYLIILDDLRGELWESVKYAFPRNNRSRVIITTRRGDTAYSCRHDTSVDVYNLKSYLPYEKAKELFCTRAFPKTGVYPSARQLRTLSENLFHICEGLPLGIIEIGKLLSNSQQTVSEFQKLHDSLQTRLASGQSSRIKKVLLLSYNDLPDHLKLCFLYMSMFAYPMKRRTLIRLWMAEGFIKEEKGKQLEDVGEEYLKELIERNLILASELDFDGRPVRCRLHNLMHMIALSKSADENFVTVCTDSGSNISMKTRRLSIQKRKIDESNEIPDYARTLFFSNIDIDLKTPPCISSTFKLLKILHLDGARVDEFPQGIDQLFLLKYLCLSNTGIRTIPTTIERLQFLETLDFKQTFVKQVPNTLSNLEKLRHLLVYRYDIGRYLDFNAVVGFEVPENMSKLKNLEKLSFVKVDDKLIIQLQNLTQLRKLGIVDLPSGSGWLLCEAIRKLKNLHSLSVASRRSEEVLEIQEIDNPPPLQRLYLKGRLEKMPQWIAALHDLVRILLRWSRLTNENKPIPILGELPNLLELQMLDAYTGDELEFNAGKFPKLKILEFEGMDELKTVVIENGALPCMQKLIIRLCKNLRQIPQGIVNIQLNELCLMDLSPAFVDPLRRKGQMHYLVQHIERLYSLHRKEDGAWGPEDDLHKESGILGRSCLDIQG